jgi:hypothetical protein
VAVPQHQGGVQLQAPPFSGHGGSLQQQSQAAGSSAAAATAGKNAVGLTSPGKGASKPVVAGALPMGGGGSEGAAAPGGGGFVGAHAASADGEELRQRLLESTQHDVGIMVSKLLDAISECVAGAASVCINIALACW